MQPQVTHEAEVHRQHVRLQVPIAVEVDGTRFTVDDWSMGGFGVMSEMSSRQPGERFSMRVIFPFEDFEVSIRLDGQMVYVLEDNTRFGCKFLSLSQGQLSLFRYLIDAYLSGELVSGGDVLAIAGRDNSAQARIQAANFNPYAQANTFGRRVKRAVGFLFLLAAGVGIVALVGLGLNERFIVVQAENAYVHAPTERVRAPLSGVLNRLDAPALLNIGTPIGRLQTVEQGLIPIVSSCNCILLDWALPDGSFAAQGDEIAVLVSSEAPLQVRAEVAYERAFDLQVGGRATMRIPGQEAAGGEILSIDFKARTSVNTSMSDGSNVLVTIKPDEPLDFETLGSLVDVRF